MSSFANVLDANESLQDIIALVHPDLPSELAGVEFRFEKQTICVFVNADDDSLVVSSTIPRELKELGSVAAREPWVHACDRVLLWIWRMINHQGYEDGLQLAFSDRQLGVEAVTVQLVGKASVLEVGTVGRVTTTLDPPLD